MNIEDKRVVAKQYIESRYQRVNKFKDERERRKIELQVPSSCPAGMEDGDCTGAAGRVCSLRQPVRREARL